ncbi:uncharacterized protein CC84DRAFT_1219389 [Paraphaeosphaeria sporulosa]|uniref:C3H1-type domain-containing protein n=1 Tax=Paraphaeosphaeria sporulosa TaxID=1460663 RepID=A0A177CAL7_9PLEO|nr:uncharacterized protein CC84DRAFT_1219389 [Paraphaeosphaeria sporulosa]OAG04181.1 hypothetical protein CC84DRAFT_1219389 [Paraphaeosphaeria sporulosa]
MRRSTASPSSTRLDPSIRYYIHRTPGNAIVPLIPADQLPFRLKDYPRHLSHRELSAGGWNFVGETSGIAWPLALCYSSRDAALDSRGKEISELSGDVHGGDAGVAKIEAVTHVPGTGETTGRIAADGDAVLLGEDEGEVKQIAFRSSEAMSIPDKVAARASCAASVGRTTTRSPSLTESLAAIYAQEARRVGYTKCSPLAAEEKEHCRHWIKTGACKWTTAKEGCRYKHTMPSVEKLAEIGITGVPRWFGERDPNPKAQGVVPCAEEEGGSRTRVGDASQGKAGGMCGVYTTNSVDEPMLMDMDDASGAEDPEVVAETTSAQGLAAKTAETASGASISSPVQSGVSVDAMRNEASAGHPLPTLPSSGAPPKARLAPTVPDSQVPPLDTSSIPNVAVTHSSLSTPPPNMKTSSPAPATAPRSQSLQPKDPRSTPCSPQTGSPRAVLHTKKDAVSRWKNEEAAERKRMRKGERSSKRKARVSQHRAPDQKKGGRVGRKGVKMEAQGVAVAIQADG